MRYHKNNLLNTEVIKLVTVCCISFLTGVANIGVNAAFIDNGDTVIDDTSGLEWFKPINTVDISWSDMEANFAEGGGPFEGFRHATGNEVDNLWNNAELLPGLNTNTQTQIENFWAQFGGPTQDLGGIDDADTGIITFYGELNESGFAPTQQVSVFVSESTFVGRDVFVTPNQNPFWGHSIVRTNLAAIPEPSTYLTFATLIGMVGAWRYHTRKKEADAIEDIEETALVID